MSPADVQRSVYAPVAVGSKLTTTAEREGHRDRTVGGNPQEGILKEQTIDQSSETVKWGRGWARVGAGALQVTDPDEKAVVFVWDATWTGLRCLDTEREAVHTQVFSTVQISKTQGCTRIIPMTVNGHVYLPILTMFLQAWSALQPPGLSIVNDFLILHCNVWHLHNCCSVPDGVRIPLASLWPIGHRLASNWLSSHESSAIYPLGQLWLSKGTEPFAMLGSRNVGIPQMLMQSWRATKPLVDLYITLSWTDRHLYWTLVA